MTEESIFMDALKIPTPVERAAFLEQACGTNAELRRSVNQLLQAHQQAGDFLQSGPEPLKSTSEHHVDAPGARIGPYKLLQQIGEGGMGTVFMAEQEHPVRRRVALKIIKAGMDTAQVLGRFEQERQALALMDHPNIAKVLEAGATANGRPYFAMEMVKGISITKFCDQEHLTPHERLALFIPVCHAVQHAHQKGIIHRDLKPSNVLIGLYDGKPVPKVIDFGVAKAISHKLTEKTIFTELGQVVGTVEYMAPEQAELNNLDIDTRADIYSLGALLYQLLTGSPPFSSKQLRGAAFNEMLRIIREVEPPKPSTKLSSSSELPSIAACRKLEPKRLTRMVAGDLDWIAMKCLEKERARRYETADGLAQDLQRYLADEPVEARPPSKSYRLMKFARKHRAALVSAVTVMLLLAVGIAVSTSLAIWATDAEADARLAEGHAGKERDKAVKAEAEAKEQGAEALKQAKIATANEVKAIGAAREKDDALKDLKYTLALDRVLLSQAAFDNVAVALANERLEQVPTDLRKWEWHYLKRLYQGGIFTLYGHTQQVNSAAFSRDGTRIATGSNDNTARVWDARTGSAVLELKRHTGRVSSVAFSPDGMRIVTASNDQTAIIWDARTGVPLFELKGHTQPVWGATFSPDGARLATASLDNTAKVWDARTGAHQFDLKHAWFVLSVAFSPDGTRIATSSNDKTARVWDARTGAPLLEIKGHTGAVQSVAFSPDGARLVTGSRDQTARVWDGRTGTPLLHLKGHKHTVQSVAFSPDGTHLLTGSADGLAKIWDARTGTALLELKGHTSGIICAAYSPDGIRLITGSWDGTARIWDSSTGVPLLRLKGHAPYLSSVAFSPDGARLVTGSGDGTANVWDVRRGTLLLQFKGHTGRVNGVAFSPDGKRLVTGGNDKTAKVWDARTGMSLFDLKGHTAPVTSVAFSPDGTCVATGSNDNTAKTWDARTGAPLLNLMGHPGPVNSVAFSPDGTRILTGYRLASKDGMPIRTGREDSTAKIWNARTGAPVLALTTLSSSMTSAVFSPDGTRFATADLVTEATVWDAHTGAPLLELKGHGTWVQTVAFSPDGTRLVTSSNDKTVRVWDARTGTPLVDLKGDGVSGRCVAFSPDGTRLVTGSGNTAIIWDAPADTPELDLKGHSAPVRQVAFSPDGTRLVTGSDDKTAIVWDAHTRMPLLQLKGHSDRVSSVAFSRDGKRIVTGSLDKTAKVWDARAGTLLLHLKGHDVGVFNVAFSSDGTRVITATLDMTAKIWNAHTGQELHEKPGHVAFYSEATSPDGRYLAHPDGNRVLVIDLVPSPEEREYRLFWTRPRPDLHREKYIKAMIAKDAFAARFHRDRVGTLDAQFHVDFGEAKRENNDPEGAIAEYREAIGLDPNLIMVHKRLAMALADKNDWDGTIVACRQILTLDPKDVDIPTRLGEQGRPYFAARLFAAAFYANPKLATDLDADHCYNAACAAALAANGQGKDADGLDDKGRTHWRKQALDWLRADLADYAKQLDRGLPGARTLVRQRLEHWQRDVDLIGIRDQEVVAKLTAQEQEACRQLWGDVEALISKTMLKQAIENGS